MSLFYSAGLGGSAIPDGAISKWEFEQDLTDSWGNLDFTDQTSTGYTTDAQQGTYAKIFDGDNDYVTVDTGSWLPTGSSWSIAVWFDADALVSDDRIIENRADPYIILNIGRSGIDTLGLFDGDDHAIGTITTGENYVGIGYDGNGTYVCYLNTGDSVTTTISSTPGSQGTNSLRVGASTTSNEFDGAVSQINSYDMLLSASEWDSLYNTGSI